MKHFGNFVALLIVAVNALFTGLLLLVAYSPYIQPATHPVQSCLGLTFPVFALINGGFLIFWLVIQRYKTALLPLTGLLLCYSQLRTYLPLNFHTTELPEGSIKLLSYNIMGFDGAYKKDGKNPILTYLKESNADILCLQEYASDESPRHLTHEDTITLINNHLESNKLTKADKDIYEEILKAPETEKVKSGARLLLHKLAEASAIRAPQADTIAREIASSRHPSVIVCGDFNDTPISYAHRVIAQNLDDAFTQSGRGLGISYNQNKFYFRIDNILISKNLRSYNCTVDRSIRESDHYPIWCYIAKRQ